MIVVVEGTKAFSDYETFTRAMSVALANLDKDNDGKFDVWTAGPNNINNYTASFCNITENYLKQKGIKVRFSKVPYSFIEENMQFIDYYAFFSNPNEKASRLATKAEEANVDVAIYRY
jgi:hypothetical protein